MADATPDDAREAARLAALDRYRLVGIGREAAFDHLTRLAADLFDVPISLVSIVGADTNCIRGACGMTLLSTPRNTAFCSVAVAGDDVLVVPDLAADARFADNIFVVGDPNARFYAGAPIRVHEGVNVGSLCLIDSRPRDFGDADRRRLAVLAQLAVDMIELRVERFAAERSRAALAQERALFELTVNSIREGIALFDRDLRLSVWNSRFAELLGHLPVRIAAGLDAAELIHALAARGAFGAEGAEATRDVLVRSVREDDVAVTDFTGADGRLLAARRQAVAGGGFIASLRDVTDERHIARLKDELISTVSHELRTPLTAIKGALGLLEGGAAGPLEPRAARMVGLGARNAERLSVLVDDLLDMDRLQSGQMAFHFVDADLGRIVCEAVEQNGPFAERFGVTLECRVPEAAVCAPVDEARLSQVLANLLSNAAKFTPRGGRVDVTLAVEGAVEGGCAAIRVRDAGPGVAPAFRARLFTRFAQDDRGQVANHPSTGLGLAISKAIVDAHGGTIALDEAAAGPGATFVVTLPLGGRGR